MKAAKKGRLAVFFVFTLGFVIIALNIIQIITLVTTTRTSVGNSYTLSCERITTSDAQAIANKLNGYFNSLSYYTESDIVTTGSVDDIVHWLRTHASNRSKEFDYVIFVSPDGTYYSDTGLSGDVHDRNYFRQIMQNGKDEYVDDAVISKVSGKPVIHIVKSVKVNGKTIGFFGGIVPLDSIQEYVNKITLGETGYAWIIDGTGLVIAHNQQGLQMNKNFITDTSDKDMTGLAKKMISGKPGSSWVVDRKTDKKEFVSYAPVAGTNWSIALSVKNDQVYETAYSVTYIMIVLCVANSIILLFISIMIIYFSLKPLQTVEKTISGIAMGNADLTQRITVKSNNEIGSVVNGFNLFAEKMQAIVVGMKRSKQSLAAAGENLQASTDDTSASIAQIIANIENVRGEITSQAASVEQTAGTVNQIASNIASLERMIETQSSGVSQASAAVEEMIGNIGSVNQSVEKMAGSFDDLQEKALKGSSKLEDVNDRISQIEGQSDMLQEANQAIASIAEQTNLLAMNAAIEAAHAGDSGRGFSVVADEIRKLSETSGVQSKTIGDQLNKIRESIAAVVSASAETSEAFKNVSQKIEETDELVRQIKNAMLEQSEGSKQIGQALHAMNDSTTEVKSASQEMSVGNKSILEEVEHLQEVTSVIKESVSQMSTSAGRINETGKTLTEVARKMKDSITEIGGQIDSFKV
jgi:methyl-accepting chemotaxis protein